MSLTLEEVEHIARLARLSLTEEEKNLFRQQLSAILDYFSRLQTIQETEIPPTWSLLPQQSALRDDLPRPGLTPQDLLSNAPQVEAGQFRIPPVFE